MSRSTADAVVELRRMREREAELEALRSQRQAEVARLQADMERALVSGEEQFADTCRERLQTATGQVNGITSAIARIGNQIARAEEELRRAQEREGDASQRYEAAIGALRVALSPAQTALGEFVRDHDPRRIITELAREAGDAEREIEARRTGRVFTRNTTAELLFLERPGLWPALAMLAEWQDALIACLPPEEGTDAVEEGGEALTESQ